MMSVSWTRQITARNLHHRAEPLKPTRPEIQLRSRLPKLCALLVSIAAALTWSCSDDRNTAPPVGGGSIHRPGVPDVCKTPNVGCECDEPGEVVECGSVDHRSGDYVWCAMGERTCQPGRVWGECVAGHITTKSAPSPGLKTRQLGTAMDCGTLNPCDPYCNVVVDTGNNLMDLPPGVCSSPTGGVTACGQACRYGGPTGATYASLNSSWQRLPTSCTVTPAASDQCGYDQNCIDGACTGWTSPCYDPNPAGCSITRKIDLELGPPCTVGATFHFPVCNRGSQRADTGTIKIGVYTDVNKLTTCASNMASGPGAPNAGQATFLLGTTAGRYIDPGQCIDITPGNATTNTITSTNLSARRAIGLNYDASLQECNYCNNWNAFEPAIACSGCTGLTCQQTCPATSVTGVIRDPGGTNPLPGVVVYVPNGPVTDFTDGVACDTCSSLISGTPIASAVTDYQGQFTLTNAPSGVSFPLVIQTGRWRREVTVPAIAACASYTLTGENARLPSNRSEGKIPKMAIVMGAGDNLQCLLKKIGIEDSEFGIEGSMSRIHLYTHNGMSYAGATQGIAGTGAFYNSVAKLNQYSAIIAPCDNNHTDYSAYTNTAAKNYTKPPKYTVSATQMANMKAYVDAGGRLFSTHWMGFDFTHTNYPAAITYVFGSELDANDRNAPSFVYTIDQTNPTGDLFADWANNVGASPAGAGTVTFTVWRHLAESVNAPAQRIAYGNTSLPPLSRSTGSPYWAGVHASMYTFDTPWGVPPANQCGRVVGAQTHVSAGSGTFPGGCNTAAMNGEEEAFEFLLFNTTQCIGLVTPPPPVADLAPATFTRDFEADCPHGTQPEWAYFSWQSTVPAGTSIVFKAQSADTQATLGAAVKVNAGTSSATTTGWTGDANTIDWHLENDPNPAQVSRRWLRISAYLNPNGAVSPTLLQWRQMFDCRPAE